MEIKPQAVNYLCDHDFDDDDVNGDLDIIQQKSSCICFAFVTF